MNFSDWTSFRQLHILTRGRRAARIEARLCVGAQRGDFVDRVATMMNPPLLFSRSAVPRAGFAPRLSRMATLIFKAVLRRIQAHLLHAVAVSLEAPALD
jgi:hypothetical protein